MTTPQKPGRPAPLDKITAEEILAQLKNAGIGSLDEFAQRYADAVRASMNANPRLQASFGPAFSAQAELKPKALLHRVPEVALSVDGQAVAAKEISRYNGTPLHFFVHAESHEKGQMAAYSSEADLLKQIKDVSSRPRAAQSRADISNETGYCYEHIQFGGAVLKIPRMNDYWNFQMPDLTQVYRNCFLWWCSNPWNDLISSIRTESHVLRFWENTNFGGSSITFGVWTQVPNLVPYGWNDRISSLALLGV